MFPTGFINLPGRKAAPVKPGASPSSIKCYNCQKLGHRAADCKAAKKQTNGGAKTDLPGKATAWKCFKCGREGHLKANCPDKETAAVDKTAKLESNGRVVAKNTVKFQVSNGGQAGRGPGGDREDVGDIE